MGLAVVTRLLLATLLAVAALGACAVPAKVPGAASDDPADGPPPRFTIAPDDYHVPYAGTAEDGRRFFLSDELFARQTAYVGLFLWHADGTFDEVRADPAPRAVDVPPGQAAPADADDLVAARLAELGDYVLEPIEVEPFLTKVGRTRFGWKVGSYPSGQHFVSIVPGDFIVYYAPWDGLDYDT